MDDEDLRLNTLHRFAKRSQRLVLEEYSHCEVPAGCGGVVLRWRNPDAGVPVVLFAASPREHTVYIDGARVDSARCELSVGDHVLCLHLVGADHEPGVVVVAARLDTGNAWYRSEDNAIASMCSRPRRGWWCTADPERGQAGCRATAESLDTTGWTVLDHMRTVVDAELRDMPNEQRWAHNRAVRHGGEALDLPPGAGELWVATRFTITAEDAGGPL